MGGPTGSNLVGARLAVFAWMAARSRGIPLVLESPDPAWRADLEWLGLDFDAVGAVPEPALHVLEAGSPAPEPALLLGPLSGSEVGGGLADYRARGWVPEGLLSYLGGLGWRAPELHAGLTRPELVLEFREEDLVRESLHFCPSGLEEVHALFLDELTPAELVEASLPFWMEAGLLAGDPTDRQRMEFEALALLFGSQVRLLADFPRLASFYLRDPEVGAPPEGLARLADDLERLEAWDSVPLGEAVQDLDPATFEAAERALTGREGTPGLADLMALVGRETTLRRFRRSP